MEQVWFEDYCTVDSDHVGTWAYICPECVKKYGISKALLSDGLAGGCLCSVDGCKNEAEWYLDFPKEAGKPEERQRCFMVSTDILQQTAAGA